MKKFLYFKRIKTFLSSFRGKIVFIFFIFSITLSVSIGSICFYIVYNQTLDSTIDYSGKLAGQITNNTASMANEARRFMGIANNGVVTSFINAKGDKHLEAIHLINYLKFYRLSYVLSNNIKNIYIIGQDGVAFNEATGVFNLYSDTDILNMYRTISLNLDQLVLFKVNENGLDNTNTIIIGEEILQPFTKKKLGTIILEFDVNVIRSLYSSIVLGKTGWFTIVDDKKNQIISENDQKDQTFRSLDKKISSGTSGHYFVSYNKSKWLLIYENIPNTKWKVAGAVKREELLQNTYKLGRIIILTIFLSVFFEILLYNYISIKLIFPITKLKDKMLLASKGQLNATVEVTGNNEITVLQKQYNNMLSQINNLIEKNKLEQRNLQKAELSALQAQINPHFLYNTLDTVIWMAAANESQKIIEIVDQLAVFFRIGLSKGLEWISVEREIEHVKSYLAIQQYRYSDLLIYELNIDPQVLNYKMLKMTLQPIVENALYHGIKNKEDGGKIIINSYMEGKDLVFEIIDTGIGIDKEVLEVLQQKIIDNSVTFVESEKGFGLYNVNRRIRLYCGEGYGIILWSSKEIGTKVTVRIDSTVQGGS